MRTDVQKKAESGVQAVSDLVDDARNTVSRLGLRNGRRRRNRAEWIIVVAAAAMAVYAYRSVKLRSKVDSRQAPADFEGDQMPQSHSPGYFSEVKT
jgi:hypothetical protein